MNLNPNLNMIISPHLNQNLKLHMNPIMNPTESES